MGWWQPSGPWSGGRTLLAAARLACPLGRFTVRLSPEQHRKVILAAEKAGKGVETWIEGALTKAASF